MTPLDEIYSAAFIIIALELVLMVYIVMLQPKLPGNRLFAGYMLLLSVGTYSVLVASTAADASTIFRASLIHALATMAATPLLWLLVLYSFQPRWRYLRAITLFFLGLAALPWAIGLIDGVAGTAFFFVFDPAIYSDGYVPIAQALNGRFSEFFYAAYITILNSLLVIPIAFFALSKTLPERLRRAARILLFLSLSVGLLYVPELNIPMALRSMLAPLFAALGTAWIVSTYRLFSPIELATKQVVDTVTIGLMVFDEELYLKDANAFAAQLLPLDLRIDKHKVTLPQLLLLMLPTVENKTDLLQLQAALRLKPEHTYQKEIILKDRPSSANENNADIKSWLLLNIRPVYDSRNLYIGSSCTIEDLTVERRTQAYITEAHKAIEQYAYNQALLNDITQAAIGTFDVNTDLSALAGRLVTVFEADSCYISIWDETDKKIKPLAYYGLDKSLLPTHELRPEEPSLSQEVWKRRQAIAIENVLESPYVSTDVIKHFPTRSLLALPMIADEQTIGALMIGFNQPRKFTAEEVRWGEQIARQLTLAIAKSRLLASEHEQRTLLEALQAAGQAITSTLDFEQVMDRILEEIARVVPYDVANIVLIRNGLATLARRSRYEEGGELIADTQPVEPVDIEQLLGLKKMYETKRPLLISNTNNSEGWVERGDNINSWMGIPLVAGDEPIAFLMLDKFEPGFYQTQHKDRLVAFASQATLALQHARLFTEIQRRVSELEALSKVSAALRSSDTVPNVLQAVLQAMVEVLSARIGVAFILDEEQKALISQASFPFDFYPKGIQYLLGEGITGCVAQSGKLHIASELTKDPKRKFKPGEPREIGDLKSTIALPLISEEGTLGVIHLGLDVVYEFAEDEIHTLKAMCNIVANGLQRIQIMQTLESRVANRTYELETANEQLQELDELKTKFIADVSHELRTPVANLSIYLNLLQNGDPAKWNHYVSVLQQQANRLNKLVEATLDLSRLEIGHSESQVEPVEFNKVVEEVVLGHQARAESFSLRLSVRLRPNLPQVKGNKTQLEQLVTNLVTNAINYNHVGGQIRVETSHVKSESMVCLKVIDNGMGIDQAELPHLFDRFYRGHQTGQSNIPGTGLGLAIVKEIVTRHQGRIEVSSQINSGTTFTVFLPAYHSVTVDTAALNNGGIILGPEVQQMEHEVEKKQ